MEKSSELLEQAQACLDRGDASQAHSLYVQACELDDSNAEAWMMRGALSGEAGDVSAALASIRKAIELQPGLADAHLMLAHILRAEGDNEGALASGRAAVEADADFGEAWAFTGALAGSMGEYAEAERYCREAVRLCPDDADAHVNLANAWRQQARYEEAEAGFRAALACQPGLIEAQLGLADMLLIRVRDDAALKAYSTVLTQEPNNRRALVGEAVVLEHKGDVEAASERIQPVLDAGQVDDYVVTAWLQIAAQTGSAEKALELGERQLGKQDGGRQRVNLHFALGKVCDRLGEYDRAFQHYADGNRLMNADFNAQANQATVVRMMQSFSSEFLARAPRSSDRSEKPVFVIGMPRSGTSLVEQILASHSQVHGAGELLDIPTLVNRLPETLSSQLGYPECIDELDVEVLNRLGGEHLARLDELSGSAVRVIDKLPSNFLSLGLIELLFPGARIVHCRRDPLDTCLSCYFQPFIRGHDFAYDLQNLAAYYRNYDTLMEHWRAVSGLPMLDIVYEDLVSEPEVWTRRLIEFTGLDWEDNCLRSHELRREITTASYDQVRQPIYKSSAGRWRNYQHHLQPLIDALDV